MNRNILFALPMAFLIACSPAATPAKPAEPSKPAEASKPAESAKPADPSKPAAQQPASSDGKAEFNAMVERAKKSDGRIKWPLVNYDSESIRELEKRFDQRFGIKLTLENEPGHPSREVPQKILQGMDSKTGIVAGSEGGNPSNFVPVMQKGGWKKVPWDPLAQEWPEIKDLRTMYPDVPGGPNGTTLQDYCMLNTQQVWSLAYNTRNVKADEVKNLKWDDLLTEKWKGRLAFDAQALGFKEMPFMAGWGPDRVKAYSNNLGANGLKLISGGSSGVVQTLTQGEGDIGWVSMDIANAQISKGAPLAFAFPEFAASNFLLTCTSEYPATDPDLAMLFFAWRNIEGEWALAELGGGGARPFYAPEADRYPLGKILKEAGWTPEKNFAGPKTAADFDLIEPYRTAAIEAQKAGIQTGQKVPYPWACEANHPACVK
jgi:hypothetical protein